MPAPTTGMRPSADPLDLLASDDREEWADLREHPAWRMIMNGETDRRTVADLIVALAPLFTGRARYLLAAKVSWLGPQDAETVFADLHRSLIVPEANADSGWEHLARSLGASGEEISESRLNPLPVVEDMVTVVRDHGLRSAHEAVGVAWVLDRRLADLLGDLADALFRHYGVKEEALVYLRYRQAERVQTEERVRELAARYLLDPWETFVARRAGREVLWGLVATLEEVAGS